MTHHPALKPGALAIITGGASGIGLAAGQHFARLGMDVVLADRPGHALDDAVSDVQAAARQAGHESRVLGEATDVSQLDQLHKLKARVESQFGHIGVLMNNAGINDGGGAFEKLDRWRALFGVNLWGVIQSTQVFAPLMIEQAGPSLIINTGSKQGITNPPGDTAYNVTKAGVKSYTESLAHELRNIEGCQASAHLLVPGFTYTGMSKARHATKPDEAWTPAQVIERLDQQLAHDDFYIICPDNAVDEETDRRRTTWGTADITENRPALSRWHPDYKDAFDAFMKQGR